VQEREATLLYPLKIQEYFIINSLSPLFIIQMYKRQNNYKGIRNVATSIQTLKRTHTLTHYLS